MFSLFHRCNRDAGIVFLAIACHLGYIAGIVICNLAEGVRDVGVGGATYRAGRAWAANRDPNYGIWPLI